MFVQSRVITKIYKYTRNTTSTEYNKIVHLNGIKLRLRQSPINPINMEKVVVITTSLVQIETFPERWGGRKLTIKILYHKGLYFNIPVLIFFSSKNTENYLYRSKEFVV